MDNGGTILTDNDSLQKDQYGRNHATPLLPSGDNVIRYNTTEELLSKTLELANSKNILLSNVQVLHGLDIELLRYSTKILHGGLQDLSCPIESNALKYNSDLHLTAYTGTMHGGHSTAQY